MLFSSAIRPRERMTFSSLAIPKDCLSEAIFFLSMFFFEKRDKSTPVGMTSIVESIPIERR